ncbi:Aspartate aminotransferase [hydrothermal vent metagenome]|uniref:cysteine-S-conjugate beta-lyase n=1 Tax=hydrothermal vent metagenome TaxID=652676 RepID=A0A1W1C228_9ZZZZ
MFDFSTAASRVQSNAEKYTLREKLFGTEDVLPAWVADMDINTPKFVLDAVKKRLEHPIVGYEEMPESAFLAQIAWMQKRHGITFKPEEMFYSHSVVASMAAAIEAFTQKGEGVIVQTPVYPPFFHTVKKLQRRLVLNPLQQREDGSYTFDIDDFRAKIDKDTKLLLLCSPHNPVGRVWRKEELCAIAELCYENGIVVFADEIHCDLVYKPNRHTPFASINAHARDITATAIGVGKTFNMAGFAISSVAIPSATLREQFQKVYERVHFAQGSVLSHVAFEAAYKEGDIWLEALLVHLRENYEKLAALLSNYEDLIRLTPIEGTYLAWLDCRGMGLKDRELREWFVKEAKLGLNAGLSFGREGSGFMRLNFAVPSDTMQEIIQRLQEALK